MSDRPETPEPVPDLIAALLEDESNTMAEDLAKAVQETVKGQVSRDIENRVHQILESEVAPLERKLHDELRRPLDRIEREYTPLSEFRTNLDRLRDSLMRMVEKEIQSLLSGPELKNFVDDRASDQILRETERLATKISDRLEERLAEALAARPSQKELTDLFDRMASALRGEIGQYVAGHTAATVQKILKKEQIVGREYLLAEFRTTLADAIANHTQSDVFREGVEKILGGPAAKTREERLAQSIRDEYLNEIRTQRNAIIEEVQEGLNTARLSREEMGRLIEKRLSEAVARLAAAEEKLGHLSETAAKAAINEVQKALSEDRTARESLRKEFHTELDAFTREVRNKYVTEEALEGRLSRFVEQIQPHFARLEASLSQCIQTGELEIRLRKINADIRQTVQQWEEHLAANYLRKEVIEARTEAINSVIEGTKAQFAQLEEELRHYAKEASVDELFRVTLHEWREELAEKVSEILHNTKLDLLPSDVARLKKEIEERAQTSLAEIQRRFDSEVSFVRERIKLIESKIDQEISRPEAERLIETVKREIHSDFTELIVRRVHEMQSTFTKELQERLMELSRAQESIVKRIPQVAEQVLQESALQEQFETLRRTMAEGLEKKVGEAALQNALSASLQRIQLELASQIQRAIREAEINQRSESLQQTRRLIQETESDIRRMVQEAMINHRLEMSSEGRQMSQQLQMELHEKIRSQIHEAIQSRPTFREIEERLFRSTAETRELVLHIQEEVKELATMIGEMFGGSSRRSAPALRRPLRTLPTRAVEPRPGGAPSPSTGPRPPIKERRPGW